MTLDRYLRSRGISDRDFAAEIGVSPGTVGRLRRKERAASAAMALQIETITDGIVKSRDLTMSTRSRRDLTLIVAAMRLSRAQAGT